MGDKELIKAILHYQQCLDKYTQRNDETRVLYCLSKLYKMPISIGHLQETGVGRTVNALRKHNGEIAEAAKTLVGKWKEMVAADTEETDTKETSKLESIKNVEVRDKHKPSTSSHRITYKKKSNSSSDEDSKHNSKKRKGEIKHKHYEIIEKKNKHEKRNSSKRKRNSSSSSSSSSDESEADGNDKLNSDHSNEEDIQSKIKQKHLKRNNDFDDENQDYDKIKHKKYSKVEKSDEEQEIKEKTYSQKSSRYHHDKKLIHEHKKNKKSKSIKDKSKKDELRIKENPSSSSCKNSFPNSEKRKDKKIKDSKSSSKILEKNKTSKTSSKLKMSHSMGENGIGSGSGASFAEALGMLMPSGSKTSKKKVAVIHPLPAAKLSSQSRGSSPELDMIPELLAPKKLGPLDIKIDTLLPEITPNYRPLGLPLDNGLLKNKLSNEDETLSAIMYNKISRTKVYSGNKVAWGKVPSLFDICTRVLQDNIDALEYTGGVPYLILKPVIERANPDQLFMLEHHNPYLIEDTDELWQLHCNKEFRTKKREEMETWRDMYMRCLDEREAKLRALTANIKQSQDKSLPVRQTKLAYVDSIVKPPRNIARKQAKHGTAGLDKKPVVTPSSRLNIIATSSAAGQISVPNPGPRAVSNTGSSTAVVKPKKAPLMQKTLALMKSRIFRR